ncbi:hypothetical protein UUU_35050 [Klebsiella pneumoniae subsp. pneumoniae DSM 30104 = JCM 1662 = NBRC 14940]|nr:hypothetical protein UUU_35050 [Klebsiella pneumoniae subsp. pneumoniae DSM 30104 = JCM 1662 = NBRC 14940]
MNKKQKPQQRGEQEHQRDVAEDQGRKARLPAFTGNQDMAGDQ